MNTLYNYKILSVNKIVDGDTVDLTIDLGFNLTKTDRYRLKGYDAPETFRPSSSIEKEAGLKIKAYLESLLTSPNLYVKTYKDTDIYGRYSGEIFSNDKSLNEMVITFMTENKLFKENLK